MNAESQAVVTEESAQPTRRGAGVEQSAAWAAFAAAESVPQVCTAWLNLLAGQIDGTEIGLVLLKNATGDAYVPAAVWPNERADASLLVGAAETALAERRGVELWTESRGVGTAAVLQVALPVESRSELQGVVVLSIRAKHADDAQTARRLIYWASAWLERLFLNEALLRAETQSTRAATALDVTLAVLEQADLHHAAITLVNRCAVELSLMRASLGLLRGDAVVVTAISNSAQFQRRSEGIAAIERAMEEALDQSLDIHLPPDAESTDFCSRTDHERLAELSGAGAISSYVLRDRGRPFGVLTFERAATPNSEAAALGAAIAELAAPVLADKSTLERWVTGKLRRRLDAGIEALLGPGRASVKLGAIAALAIAVFLALAEGDFRISAKTVVEGMIQRAAVAPFEGYIEQAEVRAGDTVKAGQLLATLEDKDLQLEKLRWDTEREQALRKFHDAQAKHDRASANVLLAQLNQAEAQLGLIGEKLARTRILAPFDGIVVSGDLSQMLGAPVEQGKVLFEIAPLDDYRVILKVDERDIAYLSIDQRGELALSGLTGVKLPFRLSKITPVSVAEEGVNVFRVEARLEQAAAYLRPGMEGIGKVTAGERKLWWIWTRRLRDWITISLWKWLP